MDADRGSPSGPPIYDVPPPPPPPPPLPPSKETGIDRETKAKYRRLPWKKIPDAQIQSTKTIWSPESDGSSRNRLSVDLEKITDLFAVKDPSPKLLSPSSRLDMSGNRLDREKQVTLLSVKQCMNINIFLRQFKRSHHVIVQSIKECDTSILSTDQLKTLLKLLPDEEAIAKLQESVDESTYLDNADKFIFDLVELPSYKLRIEYSIFYSECIQSLKELRGSVTSLDKAISEIRQCRALPTILHFLLQTGNFLNQGASYGNASGFRLSSLKALIQTKANRPGITLMHYVAMELEKQDAQMMNWPNLLPSLSLAKGISLVDILSQLNNYRKKLDGLKKQMLQDKNEELRSKTVESLKTTEKEIESVITQHSEVKKRSDALGLYLCEEPGLFSLEECMTTVAEFRDKFSQAVKENNETKLRKARKESTRKRGTNHSRNALSSHSFSSLGDISLQERRKTTGMIRNPLQTEANVNTQSQERQLSFVGTECDKSPSLVHLRKETSGVGARVELGCGTLQDCETRTRDGYSEYKWPVDDTASVHQCSPNYRSVRDSFKQRHSNRRARTDLGLSRFSTIEGVSARATQATAASPEMEKNENATLRRSRHDDIRERIRRYKESCKEEDRDTRDEGRVKGQQDEKVTSTNEMKERKESFATYQKDSCTSHSADNFSLTKMAISISEKMISDKSTIESAFASQCIYQNVGAESSIKSENIMDMGKLSHLVEDASLSGSNSGVSKFFAERDRNVPSKTKIAWNSSNNSSTTEAIMRIIDLEKSASTQDAFSSVVEEKLESIGPTTDGTIELQRRQLPDFDFDKGTTTPEPVSDTAQKNRPRVLQRERVYSHCNNLTSLESKAQGLKHLESITCSHFNTVLRNKKSDGMPGMGRAQLPKNKINQSRNIPTDTELETHAERSSDRAPTNTDIAMAKDPDSVVSTDNAKTGRKGPAKGQIDRIRAPLAVNKKTGMSHENIQRVVQARVTEKGKKDMLRNTAMPGVTNNSSLLVANGKFSQSGC